MNLFIIGNIVALLAATFSAVIGYIKNRQKVIYIQTFQLLLFTTSTLLLGGFTGAIANFIGAIRNILCYKEKLTKVAIILIISISTVLTLMFNNLGFIGLFPLISTIIYTLFINEKNPLKFKILFLTTTILWFIYDITIKSYTGSVFDFITIITSIIATYQIYKNQKKKQQN